MNYKRKKTKKYNVSCHLCKPEKRQGNKKSDYDLGDEANRYQQSLAEEANEQQRQMQEYENNLRNS
jgi:DNA primase